MWADERKQVLSGLLSPPPPHCPSPLHLHICIHSCHHHHHHVCSSATHCHASQIYSKFNLKHWSEEKTLTHSVKPGSAHICSRDKTVTYGIITKLPSTPRQGDNFLILIGKCHYHFWLASKHRADFICSSSIRGLSIKESHSWIIESVSDWPQQNLSHLCQNTAFLHRWAGVCFGRFENALQVDLSTSHHDPQSTSRNIEANQDRLIFHHFEPCERCLISIILNDKWCLLGAPTVLSHETVV